MELSDDSDERILKCLDRALDSLGESVKRVTYFYLAKEDGVVTEDLVRNPQKFLAALRNFYGEGADIIEHWMIRQLRKEAHLSIEESRNLLDAIQKARTKLTGRSVY